MGRGRQTKFIEPWKHDRETKAHYAERVEYLGKLHDMLRPGDTISMVLRHVSSSGMYRAIDFYLLGCEDTRPTRMWLSYWIAAALDMRFDERREALGVSGAGMDMGFHVVYNLSSVLYPNGFYCIGDRCPWNGHSNGDRDYKRGHLHPTGGGYALRHDWIG